MNMHTRNSHSRLLSCLQLHPLALALLAALIPHAVAGDSTLAALQQLNYGPITIGDGDISDTWFGSSRDRDSLTMTAVAGGGDASLMCMAEVLDGFVCMLQSSTSSWGGTGAFLFLLVKVRDDSYAAMTTTEWRRDILTVFWDQLSPEMMAAYGEDMQIDSTGNGDSGSLTCDSRILAIPMSSNSDSIPVKFEKYDDTLWRWTADAYTTATLQQHVGVSLEIVPGSANERYVEIRIPLDEPCGADLRGKSYGFTISYSDADTGDASHEQITWLGGAPNDPAASIAEYWGAISVGVVENVIRPRGPVHGARTETLPMPPAVRWHYSLLGQRTHRGCSRPSPSIRIIERGDGQMARILHLDCD